LRKSTKLRGKAVAGAEDRQKKIPGFDQEVFSKSRVLCVGAGGIISQIAPTLVRKGIGRTTVLDNDIVEPSNLNRQRFYARDIGRNKALALARNLKPECIAATEIRGYPTMDIDDIKAMPVEEIADDDATLWLWTTNAHLRVAFDVIDSWGFEYRTLLTWVKDRMGTGEWLRGQTEHCMLAVRGKPVFLHGNHGTVLEAARREHSRKPEEFYSLVEATCPGLKVELFSRSAREGWRAFGNDTGAFVSEQGRLKQCL
jgi:N6-adenosine-specific RNA methylase IME4